jgi:hypothetical protein
MITGSTTTIPRQIAMAREGAGTAQWEASGRPLSGADFDGRYGGKGRLTAVIRIAEVAWSQLVGSRRL